MGEVLATNPSSSNPAKSYNIIKGADDVIYCDCPGWKMRKTCKHLEEFNANATPPSAGALPTKAWVVMEIGWQYNDEYYYTDDNDSGTPQKVYFDKQKAQDAALDQNIKALSSNEIGSYATDGDISTILEIDEEDFKTMVKDMGGSVGDYEINLPEKLKRADAMKILAAINIRWFDVQEIPVGK